ncbi:hypothetical protein HPP92_000817 [Vanilla planifolia]|uniref:Uncharacterized protein n=1 Tax=Vanilla planifolia TaxID=51239 RepID=A0A835S5K3_VANPL|nr:hypothetical protein HPP92_000817 [Vanilla planifolia]
MQWTTRPWQLSKFEEHIFQTSTWQHGRRPKVNRSHHWSNPKLSVHSHKSTALIALSYNRMDCKFHSSAIFDSS